MANIASVLKDQIRLARREFTAGVADIKRQVLDVARRLAVLEKQRQAASPATRRRRPGKFKQSADQLILSLLQKHKRLTTTDINAAWKKDGRAGNANVNLSKLVKARKIKRTTLKGQNKSQFSLK
jgi:hypothetical protein